MHRGEAVQEELVAVALERANAAQHEATRQVLKQERKNGQVVARVLKRQLKQGELQGN
jgi:hypothetical protein